MAEDKEDLGPATPSAAYREMAPKWAMISTLLGGTQAMRSAGQAFLPQHPGESHENYAERLGTATLLNMLELTLDSLVGKVFSTPIKANADVPEGVGALLPDIDTQGNSLNVFCREWFREGFAKGFAHCLIDIQAPQTPKGRKRTKADDLKEGRRPYWSLICPDNVVFMLASTVAGKEMLSHVRMLETETILEGWKEVIRQRVRVLEPGIWTLYELREIKTKGADKGKKKWVKIDEGDTGLDVIPLVTFYCTKREALALAKPPLEDLAYLNVRHWQSTSDQTNILTVARFPILAVAGMNDQAAQTVVVGPRTLLHTKHEQGRYYYVEHTGAAIGQGWSDLADLEQQMANYGAEFLRKKPGNQTATARALDSAEATSPLQDAAERFLEPVARALDLTALWLGIAGKGGTIKIVADLKPDPNEAEVFKTLVEAFKEGAIDAEEFREALRERSVLNEATRLIKRVGVKSSTAVGAEAKKTVAEKPTPPPAAK